MLRSKWVGEVDHDHDAPRIPCWVSSLAGFRCSREKINVPEILDEPVVIDGNIITSQGPGTTFLFSLAIIALLEGKEKADSLAEGMILDRKDPYVV